MKPPGLQDYLKLFRLYERELVITLEPRGARLEFPFARTVALLNTRSPFNATLPKPFLDVARRIAAHEPAAIEHFGYDENRQFFLGDLYDYLRLRALNAARSESS